jgi:uncharacterized membrane protein
LRSLQIQIRASKVDRVLSLASAHGARSPTAVPAGEFPDDGAATDRRRLLFVDLPNATLGDFVKAVAEIAPEASFSFLPAGALPLEPPLHRVHRQVRDVSRLSTLELVLASLQSVGAWQGMLIYSALAGVIATYGLIFDAGYVLVAAMLVNPMGAPALVAVVGMSIGDARMFGRGALRFLVSLAVQALTALATGFLYGIEVSTAMMEQITALSLWGVLLALAAGAAGAQTQIKSDRDSLVSGTAAGFMVAAALAPPAAVLGLAVPLGRWDYAGLMAFLLVLQFLAIAAGGWLLLHLLGVRPADPAVGRGRARSRTMLAVAVSLAAVVLVAWQATQTPRFLKADLSRSALEIARDAVREQDGVRLVEAAARFTRPELRRYSGEGLLIELVVERTHEQAADAAEQALRTRLARRVEQRMAGVLPFVHITVLPPVQPASR